MDRPDLLSQHEAQLVDVHRAALKIKEQEKTAGAQGDFRSELSNVYQEFVALEHDLDSPPFAEALMNLYRLLY